MMHLLKRQIWLSSLIFACLTPASFTFLFLQHKKRQVQQRVKMEWLAQLPENQLTVLQLSPTDARTAVRWEHSRELEWNGQMFDVVRIDTLPDGWLHIRCWHDAEESVIELALDQWLEKNWQTDNIPRETHRQLTDFFKSLFLPPSPDLWTAMPARVPVRCSFLTYEPVSTAHLSSVFTPPEC